MKNSTVKSIINFCYFLYNFPMPFERIIHQAWENDPNLSSQHLLDKWSGIQLKYKELEYTSPQMILDFMMLLSDNHKAVLIEWIENNYKA